MFNKKDTKTVQEYYDYTLPFYRVFWHGKTRAIHYGVYQNPSDSFEKALLNANQLLADTAGVTESDVVLDAGCGVGGSALWLAGERGARVTGISISHKQIEKARELAARNGLEKKVSFVEGDYFSVPFEDASFSLVWGLESMCYAQHDMRRFLHEMSRVLQKGGRIVIGDGFLGSKNFSKKEQEDVNTFCVGFALKSMITVEECMDALREAGFTAIRHEDVTEKILPTAKRMYKMALYWYPLIWLLSTIGVIPTLMKKNSQTGLVQERLFKNRALVYGVLYAKKI